MIDYDVDDDDTRGAMARGGRTAPFVMGFLGRRNDGWLEVSQPQPPRASDQAVPAIRGIFYPGGDFDRASVSPERGTTTTSHVRGEGRLTCRSPSGTYCTVLYYSGDHLSAYKCRTVGREMTQTGSCAFNA